MHPVTNADWAVPKLVLIKPPARFGEQVCHITEFFLLGKLRTCTCIRQEYRVAAQMESPRSLGL
ncbi:hypothetical protein BJD11_01440 (plasmid) [Xanthomonas euvesicatoria]|nr:hypothetical protein BJD11_01440 [Xanthomonas euvesicatoria]